MSQLSGGEHSAYTLRSGITLYPSQNQAISRTMSLLVQKVPAHFALLTDVTGQVILARGEQENVDLIALGSLVAGDVAASQEIARLTDQYQDFQVVLREGKKMHTFILETGLYLVLFVQVSTEIPLGWARMAIKNSAQELAKIVADTPEEVSKKEISDDTLGQEDLPDLFSEALDDLWLE